MIIPNIAPWIVEPRTKKEMLLMILKPPNVSPMTMISIDKVESADMDAIFIPSTFGWTACFFIHPSPSFSSCI
jgi:hypothetical protein